MTVVRAFGKLATSLNARAIIQRTFLEYFTFNLISSVQYVSETRFRILIIVFGVFSKEIALLKLLWFIKQTWLR